MPKITGKGKGAALNARRARHRAPPAAMRQASPFPSPSRFRGWDDEHLKRGRGRRMAESEGRGRHHCPPAPRAQAFTGKAPWTIIAEVVEAVRIPVTGNGDVDSMDTARRMVDERVANR